MRGGIQRAAVRPPGWYWVYLTGTTVFSARAGNPPQKEADDNHRSGFLGHVILLATKVEEFLNSFDYRPNKLEYLREDVLDDFEHFCEHQLAEEKQRMNAVGTEVTRTALERRSQLPTSPVPHADFC